MTRILPALLCALLLAATRAQPSQPPWHRSAGQIARSCSNALSVARRRSKILLAAKSAPSYASIVLPLEDLTADLHDATAVDRFLRAVSPDAPVRAASLACRDRVASFLQGLASEPRLYAALARARRRGVGRDAAHRALVARWLQRARRAGAAAAPARRAELQRREVELEAVRLEFERSLHAAILRDVPANRRAARTFLRHEPQERLRRAFYLAYEKRAAGDAKLVERAIALRDRIAHLLGYESWDDYRLATRMARTPDRVLKLLGEIDAALMPAARSDLAALTAIKAERTADPAAKLEPWDLFYYDRIERSMRYPLVRGALRAYFPARHTLAAVFDLLGGTLGVDFVPLPGAVAWKSRVAVYQISDATDGRLLGTTYVDLHALPASYQGFRYVTLLPARKLPGGGFRPEVTAILGDVPPAAPGKPSLLRYADLVRLFGAAGSNLAALLSTAPYETLAVAADRDMANLPAQIFENYAGQKAILESIGADPLTGASPPAALVEAAIERSRIDRPLFTARRLSTARLELEYQMRGPLLDTTTATQPPISFEALMDSDGVACYDSLWSRPYAQEIFSVLERDGLTDPATGTRLRREILELGAVLDQRSEVERFTGHRLTLAPFYDYLGVSGSV